MAKESFADIYEQWTKTHDEQSAMQKKAKAHEGSALNASGSSSINEVRRMKAQAELDLHEFRLEEAVVRTRSFLDDAKKKGLRHVRIITGKGIHSKDGASVLRGPITEVAKNHPAVREVFTPKAAEGGSGALTVILKG